MNIVTDKLDNGKIKITVDVDEKQWHVPDNIADKYVNSGQVFDEAINKIFPLIFDEVIVFSKINPLTKPEINIEKYSTTSLTVNFMLNVVPKIEINNYKNGNIQKEKISVTDDEVNESIKQLLEQYAEFKIKDDKAA